MKINEFLEGFFNAMGPIPHPELGHFDNYLLMPEQLEVIKEGLLKCEEFKNTKELVILDMPRQPTADGKAKEVVTIKVNEGLEMAEKVYLYNIFLGPEEYETKTLTKPVKDDVSILPTIYDEDTFTPRKGITIFWSPEEQQDYSAAYDKGGDDFVKEKIVSKLKKALEKPEEYRVKGRHQILMRLMVESIKTSDQNENPTKFNPQFVKFK